MEKKEKDEIRLEERGKVRFMLKTRGRGRLE